MTQAAAKHHCKKCNRSVAAWANTCPHCKGFNCIALGPPPKDGASAYQDERPVKLRDVEEGEAFERVTTGTREFDRVLGGGLVIGSVVLVSGDPGIGKSTLLTQTAIDLTVGEVTDEETGEPTESLVGLYVGPEETNAQIKNRTRRIARGARDLYLFQQIDVVEIGKHVEEIRPDFIVIDSIQKMVHPDIDGPAGSVQQVRACGAYIAGLCKRPDQLMAGFIVAHITKEGTIAGPKTLEHDVDVVLEFGREGHGDLRSVRASKNRFGSTNEMALFRMTGEGLESIANPSELLLEHHRDGVTGTCVAIAANGPRPVAVEIQTLFNGVAIEEEDAEAEIRESLAMLSAQGHMELASTIETWLKRKRRSSSQKRHVTGLDRGRVNQVMAILEARACIPLDASEMIISIAGGIEMGDPGLDLPLALALASYVLGKALPKSFCAFGEIGLGGEIRTVEFTEARVKQAKMMGFETIAGPVLPKREDPYALDDKDKTEDEEEDFAQLAESEPPGRIQDPDDDDDGEERYMGFSTLVEVIEAVLQETAPKKKTQVADKPKRKKKREKKLAASVDETAILPEEDPHIPEAPPPM